MTFEDLIWKPHRISASYFYASGTLPNGVGYSVVFDPISGYMNEVGLARVYNVGTDRDDDLNNDSLAFVTPAEVTAVLEKAAGL